MFQSSRSRSKDSCRSDVVNARLVANEWQECPASAIRVSIWDRNEGSSSSTARRTAASRIELSPTGATLEFEHRVCKQLQIPVGRIVGARPTRGRYLELPAPESSTANLSGRRSKSPR